MAQLGWQTLDQRRPVARLCLFYKIVNGLVAVPLPNYISAHRISRYCHSMTFRQIHTGKDYYKYKGTSRQRSGKGAVRKRFPLQKPRWEKTKLTIRYLYHETYQTPAVVQWNALPASVAVSPSLGVLKAAVGELQHPKP